MNAGKAVVLCLAIRQCRPFRTPCHGTFGTGRESAKLFLGHVRTASDTTSAPPQRCVSTHSRAAARKHVLETLQGFV